MSNDTPKPHIALFNTKTKKVDALLSTVALYKAGECSRDDWGSVGLWICGRRDASYHKALIDPKVVSSLTYKAPSEVSKPNNGFVYFIKAGDLVKIGHSVNIKKRLETLQVASPVTLTLIGTMEGNYHLEQKLHLQFARYRVRGEWFELSEPIKEYIKEHCQ